MHIWGVCPVSLKYEVLFYLIASQYPLCPVLFCVNTKYLPYFPPFCCLFCLRVGNSDWMYLLNKCYTYTWKKYIYLYKPHNCVIIKEKILWSQLPFVASQYLLDLFLSCVNAKVSVLCIYSFELNLFLS